MESYCCKPADLNKLLKRFYAEFILKQARLGYKYKPDILKVIYDDSFGQAFERQRITSLRENAQTKPCMLILQCILLQASQVKCTPQDSINEFILI